jgi:hypothetical protein
MVVKVKAEEAYFYTQNRKKIVSLNSSSIERRRRLILGQLFRHVSTQNLKGLDTLKAHLDVLIATNDQLNGEKDSPVKYMAVHSRSLEGSCEQRLTGTPPHDECNMNPTYIKDILRRLGLLGHMPIVVISDMQNQTILDNLLANEEIGKHIIVPALNPKFDFINFPASDMMIAVMSDFFVGPRVSSMTVMIGLIRAVLGADLQSNYIYVTQRPAESTDRQFDVCGECIFNCEKGSAICGESNIEI